MSYTISVSLTTRMVADRLGVTPKRVREIAKQMKIKPSWMGPIMTFTPMQLEKMRNRNTAAGRPKKRGARR